MHFTGGIVPTLDLLEQEYTQHLGRVPAVLLAGLYGREIVERVLAEAGRTRPVQGGSWYGGRDPLLER